VEQAEETVTGEVRKERVELEGDGRAAGVRDNL
jgi:hypothetical protein